MPAQGGGDSPLCQVKAADTVVRLELLVEAVRAGQRVDLARVEVEPRHIIVAVQPGRHILDHRDWLVRGIQQGGVHNRTLGVSQMLCGYKERRTPEAQRSAKGSLVQPATEVRFVRAKGVLGIEDGIAREDSQPAAVALLRTVFRGHFHPSLARPPEFHPVGVTVNGYLLDGRGRQVVNLAGLHAVHDQRDPFGAPGGRRHKLAQQWHKVLGVGRKVGQQPGMEIDGVGIVIRRQGLGSSAHRDLVFRTDPHHERYFHRITVNDNFSLGALHTLCLPTQKIVPRRHVFEYEVAGVIRDSVARFTGRPLDQGKLRVRNHCASLVFDDSGNLGGGSVR